MPSKRRRRPPGRTRRDEGDDPEPDPGGRPEGAELQIEEGREERRHLEEAEHQQLGVREEREEQRLGLQEEQPDDSGPGTLRQAILDATATPGPDTIGFAIGTGPVGIFPKSALPDLPSPPALEPRAERHRIFAAIAALLQAIAHDQPLVLALEDLQWADPTTIQALHYIQRTCRQEPLL